MSSLTAALNDSAIDRIVLAPGPYALFGKMCDANGGAFLCLQRNLTIEAAEPGSVVLQSALAIARVVHIAAGVAVSMTGVEITGASAQLNGAGVYVSGTLTLSNCSVHGHRAVHGDGGGLFVDSGGVALLDECKIFENIAENGGENKGGGVCIASGGYAKLLNCQIWDNNADDVGGGLHMTGTSSRLIMTRCNVSNNAAGHDTGGGLHIADGEATLHQCTIHGNSAGRRTKKGGGLYINQGTVALNNCSISQNNAGTSAASGLEGGGVWAGSSHVIMIGCTINGNSGGAHGGGVFASGGNLTMSGCILEANDAGWGGGVKILLSCHAELRNCMIYNNRATYGSRGGGLDVGSGAVVRMTGCDIAENRATTGGALDVRGPASLTLIDCRIHHNGGGGRQRVIAFDNSVLATMINCSMYENEQSLFALSLGHATLINCNVHEQVQGSPLIVVQTPSRRFVQTPGACQMQDGSAVSAGRHTALTQDQCAQKCDEDSGCLAFQVDWPTSYSAPTSECSLWGVGHAGSGLTNTAVVCYVLAQPVPPPSARRPRCHRHRCPPRNSALECGASGLKVEAATNRAARTAVPATARHRAR